MCCKPALELKLSINPIVPKRTYRRSRVRVMTQARNENIWFEVRVLDLSINGARLETSDPPPIGGDIHLIHGGVESRCRVTWIHGNCFGVEFHFPLDPAEIPTCMLAGAIRPTMAD